MDVESAILSQAQLGFLRSGMSAAERCYRWNLLYSLSKHGASLRSLYSRVREHHKADPCALETQFIIIQTTKGSVFGGYAAGTKLLPPSKGRG